MCNSQESIVRPFPQSLEPVLRQRSTPLKVNQRRRGDKRRRLKTGVLGKNPYTPLRPSEATVLPFLSPTYLSFYLFALK